MDRTGKQNKGKRGSKRKRGAAAKASSSTKRTRKSKEPKETLESFVEAHDVLEALPSGRIRVVPTQHECPPNLELIKKHLAGKAFARALRRAKESSIDLGKYFMPNRDGKHLAWCVLTKVSVNILDIEKHRAGPRYQRALAIVQKKEEEEAERARKKQIRKETAALRRKLRGQDATEEARRSGGGSEEEEEEDVSDASFEPFA